MPTVALLKLSTLGSKPLVLVRETQANHLKLRRDWIYLALAHRFADHTRCHWQTWSPQCRLGIDDFGLQPNSVASLVAVRNTFFRMALCKPKDASDLAEKMERIVCMSYAEREAMGALGRNKVERDFDEQIVIKKYLDTIKLALAG